MAERYGGHVPVVGAALVPRGSGLGLDGVDPREAIPEVFHGFEDAGIRIAGLAQVRVHGDAIEFCVPLDHGVPCAPDAEHPADGGMWIRATRVNVDRGEIRWYVSISVGDLVHGMYVDHATTSWSKDQIDRALDGRPDVPASYNDPAVRDALHDAQPHSLRDAARIAADRLGIADGAVTSAVDVTAQHRKRRETAAAARAAASATAVAAVTDDAPPPEPEPEPQPESEPQPLSEPQPAPEPVPSAAGDHPADTGHYDDGHSFGWPAPPGPPPYVPLPVHADLLAEMVAEIEAALGDPNQLPTPAELTRMSWAEHSALYHDAGYSANEIGRLIEAGMLTPQMALQRIDRRYAEWEAWKPLSVDIPLVWIAVADTSDQRLDELAALADLRTWVVEHSRPKGTPPPNVASSAPATPDLFAGLDAEPVATGPVDPDLDTGHYDDGHSLTWDRHRDAPAWTNLTATATAAADGADAPGPPTAPAGGSGSGPGRAGRRRWLATVGGALAVLLVVVIAAFALGGGGSGDGGAKDERVEAAGKSGTRGDAGDPAGGDASPGATPQVVSYGNATILSSEYDPPRTSTVTETPPTIQLECSTGECALLWRGTRVPGRDGAFSTVIDEAPVAQPNCPPDRHYSVTIDVRSSGAVDRNGRRVPAKLTGTITRSIPRVDVALANGSTICFGQTTVYAVDGAPA